MGGFKFRGTKGTHPASNPAREASRRRAAAEAALHEVVEHGSREAALRLPDETPFEWTNEGLHVIELVLGSPHGAAEPILQRLGADLPMAANAVAERWCTNAVREAPLCTPVHAAGGARLFPSNCPLSPVCAFALGR